MNAPDKMTSAKQDEQIARAAEAKRVLESPLVKEFLDKTKAHIRKEWETTQANEPEAREHQWRLYQVVQLFEDSFKAMIATGDFALKNKNANAAKTLAAQIGKDTPLP